MGRAILHEILTETRTACGGPAEPDACGFPIRHGLLDLRGIKPFETDREAVPERRDEERQVQVSWWQVHRRTKGQQERSEARALLSA